MGSEYVLTAKDGCVSPDDLAFMAAALDEQMRRDVGPAFGKEPWSVAAVSSLDGLSPDSSAEHVLTFQADLGVPGALGYHTDEAGVEYAVCLPPTNTPGVIDGTTASHEVIETFGDPECSETQPGPNGSQTDYELCDAVEGDAYPITVTIGAVTRVVMVSNFVLPAWFDPGSVGPFDFLGKLTAPLTMTPGGYFQFDDAQGNAQQVFADEAGQAALAGQARERELAARAPGAPSRGGRRDPAFGDYPRPSS